MEIIWALTKEDVRIKAKERNIDPEPYWRSIEKTLENVLADYVWDFVDETLDMIENGDFQNGD